MSNCGEYLQKEPKLELAKKLTWVIWVLTVVVLGLVGVMRSPTKFDQFAEYTSFLPPVHAALNTAVAVFLIGGVLAIKKGRVCWHKAFINLAMIVSILFLLCYVAYHFTNVETLYADYNKDGERSAEEAAKAGGMLTVYLVLLISHIVLAGVSLPLILFTWMYGVTNQFAKHRKFSKITFPMWLYVAVTGPVCYFMLRPFY